MAAKPATGKDISLLFLLLIKALFAMGINTMNHVFFRRKHPIIITARIDDIVKSPVPVIASSPANGGATWQSRYFKNLQRLDRRASLAMTPFSDFLRVHQDWGDTFSYLTSETGGMLVPWMGYWMDLAGSDDLY